MQDPSLYSQIKVKAQQPQVQFPEQEHLKCPRCDSTNTKFCYYNNYNLSQPRHFCKNCRRYWTKGGALRNIPVGGGSRKNAKRSSSASSAATKRPASVPSGSDGVLLTKKIDPHRSLSAPNIKNDSKGSNGEMSEALPVKGENFVGQFGNLLEASGSFSSLLGSSVGQFGNFLDGLGPNGSTLPMSDQFGDPSPGPNMDPQVLESDSNSNADGFLNIHGGDGGAGGGDGGCWSGSGGGWPDLSIYTPGSTFL